MMDGTLASPAGTALAPAAAPARMAWRRALLLAMMGALTAGLLGLAAAAVGSGGWTLPGVLLLACLLPNAPWLALGASTALIGGAVRLFARDPLLAVLPQLARLPGQAGPLPRTAIGLCLRNEDPHPATALLGRLGAALDAAGLSARFALCLLSDSDRPEAMAAEDAGARALAAATATPVLLRRRSDNAGWKAGNVMAFLDSLGPDGLGLDRVGPADLRQAGLGPASLGRDASDGGFELFVCLDSDSDMTLPAVLRLVRLMAADDRLAIVQATFAAPPPVPGRTTRFARDFALGHRAGLRVWATGQAWWQGDQGPYWGHNAVLRIAPFRAHCRLDPLPDGSAILSHDHVEAARLHAAGWKVRVLPDDAGSTEGSPPTLPDYLARDLRWAAGNMQYRHLLRDRSLGRIGRGQMAQAILHYALTPAWFALLPLAAWTALAMPHPASLRLVAAALLAGWLATALPKLLGHAEALARSDARAARLLATLRELGAGLLLDPILALEKTVLMLAMPLRRRVGWAAQAREGRRLGWAEAARRFWPHTLAGAVLLALFGAASWQAALLCLPAVAGLLAAVPYAVLGSRAVGHGRLLEGQGSALDPLGAAPPDLHSFGTESPRGDSV